MHQLSALGGRLSIIDGLPNRYVKRWDTRIRPIPDNANLIRMRDALENKIPYDCLILHNMTDLMDVKAISGSRILVLHGTIEGRIVPGVPAPPPAQVRAVLARYMREVGGHVVAISHLKGKSWGFVGDIVNNAVDCTSYLPWRGEIAMGLRVANQIKQKSILLKWDFHEAAFADIPIKVVGHNPEMAEVTPSRSWDDLKSQLSAHRFFVHTADPLLEDGYNMAVLEAMAAGLPVLGNRHPTSLVEHGVSGFLSDDPGELAHFAHRLLADRELAGAMGEKGRQLVAQRFSFQRFAKAFRNAIRLAGIQYRTRHDKKRYTG